MIIHQIITFSMCIKAYHPTKSLHYGYAWNINKLKRKNGRKQKDKESKTNFFSCLLIHKKFKKNNKEFFSSLMKILIKNRKKI